MQSSTAAPHQARRTRRRGRRSWAVSWLENATYTPPPAKLCDFVHPSDCDFVSVYLR